MRCVNMLDILNMSAKNMQLRLEAFSYIRAANTVRSDTGVCHAPLFSVSAHSMGLDGFCHVPVSKASACLCV